MAQAMMKRGGLDDGMGPYMKALIPGRQRFVRAYICRGQRNAGRAYVDAGYTAANANVAKVEASRMLHREDVQEAIREECMREIVTLLPLATEGLAKILDPENVKVEDSTRLKAIEALFNRTGLAAVKKVEHTYETIGEDPTKVAKARLLVERLGMNQHQIERMLGRTLAPKVIDVEHEDVIDEDDPPTFDGVEL